MYPYFMSLVHKESIGSTVEEDIPHQLVSQFVRVVMQHSFVCRRGDLWRMITQRDKRLLSEDSDKLPHHFIRNIVSYDRTYGLFMYEGYLK